MEGHGLPHAWCLLNGRVWDPTLTPARVRRYSLRPCALYFGVEFPDEEVLVGALSGVPLIDHGVRAEVSAVRALPPEEG